MLYEIEARIFLLFCPCFTLHKTPDSESTNAAWNLDGLGNAFGGNVTEPKT